MPQYQNDISKEAAHSEKKDEALSHPLYDIIPRHRSQIRWFDAGHWLMWALFGNDDDGIFGERSNYRSQEMLTYKKAIRWNLRNPLHNFCFYVIGQAQFRNSEVTLLKISDYTISLLDYKKVGTIDFASSGSSFFLGLHGWKPFISLRLVYKTKQSDFYIGWRSRGNFGIKTNALTRRKPTKTQDTSNDRKEILF